MEIMLCDEFFYRVNSEDINLFEQFNTSKENLLRNNENINLYCGEWVKIKVNDFKIHYVKPTQTLKEIADMYNIDIENLKKTNNLQSEKLFIGQILRIYDKN